MRKNINPFLIPEYLSVLIWTKINGNLFVSSLYSTKPYRALPEEIIRQLWIIRLVDHYGYPESMLRLEYKIQMGVSKKRADIAIISESGHVCIIIEVKQNIDDDARSQLHSYMRNTTATHGAVVSATEFFSFECSESRFITNNNDLPKYGGTLDIFNNLIPEQQINNINIEQLKNKLFIEDFTRIDNKRVKIIIKGSSIIMNNSAMSSYSKLRNAFLDDGVLIDSNLKQNDWQQIFSTLFDSASLPKISILNSSTLSNGQAALAWLLSRSIKFNNNYLSLKELIIESKNFAFSNYKLIEFEKNLARNGIKIKDDFLLLGNTFLKNLLKDSPYENEKYFRDSMLTLTGVTKNNNKIIKINGIACRCISIPLNYFLKIEYEEKLNHENGHQELIQ
jgi:hypothetical protein